MPIKTLEEYLKQTTPIITKQQATKPKYRLIGFYKETEFQKTPIGEIPKEWKVVKLKNITTLIRNGYTYKKFNREGRGVPVTRIETISNEIIDTSKLAYVESVSREDIDKYRLVEGDILFSHINSEKHIGKAAIYEGEPELLIHGMNLLLIRPNIKLIYPKFLLYLLKFYRVHNLFVRIAKRAVNQASINQTQLSNLKVFYPPLEEQWGIAEVLSSVDEAIMVTERHIGRLERLKRDLMQELLTKGIGHREYKQTPIGEIPKEWKVVRLSMIARIIMGQSPPSSTYNEDGIGLPFLQGKAEFGRMYPKPIMYTSKPIKIAEEGDLLISVRAPVGDVNIAPFKLCIGRGLASIRFNRDKASILFYLYYFQLAKPRLEAMGKGSTFKAITKKDLENLLVPLPPLDEQNRIASTLKAVDNWISAEEKHKEKLERMKRGLMELLLTGRIRVQVRILEGEKNS